MTDPCWLPSAIMQTTAALLGFFAVVYILTIEKIGGMKNKEERVAGLKTEPVIFIVSEWGFKFLDKLFIAFLGSSIFTIILNTLWLDSLSAKVLNLGFQSIGMWAMVFFGVTLGWCICFIIEMILLGGKARKVME